MRLQCIRKSRESSPFRAICDSPPLTNRGVDVTPATFAGGECLGCGHTIQHDIDPAPARRLHRTDPSRPTLMRRACAMTYGEKDFIKLLLWRGADGRARWVKALRATADYYAWTEHFEPWTPKIIGSSAGHTIFQMPCRSGPGIAAGGKRRRICWSQSTHGNPAGKTNQFTMSNSCRLIDYAELAHFSKGNWHWMSGPTGERISRDRWEAIYETAGHNRGAGLVSA